MQLRVIYRFRRSASDGPAGREVVFGPIVKRETVIVLVNASAAVPAAARAAAFVRLALRPFRVDPRCFVTLSRLTHHESKLPR